MRGVLRIFLVGVALWLGLCLSHGEARAENPETPVFERDIVPIFRSYCWKCHGGEKLVADLDLRSVPLLLQGGKSGPAIVPGSAADSRLFQKLASGDMPPGEELKPPPEHVDIIRSWIDAGATANYAVSSPAELEEPSWASEQLAWWAFQKPTRPAVPDVGQEARARTPIDAFLSKRLEERQLGFSSDADPLTLVRRLHFDLIGLPPSPEDVDMFVSDRSPDAIDRLVDRLLASPHYGERWGRHWLDACGYVDTSGVDNDATIIKAFAGMWKYRDYVIQSLNDDKPYDRFLLEQLAGDELVDWRNAHRFTPEIKDLLSATGFLRQAADVTDEAVLNTVEIRHQVLYDTVQIFTTNVLGLTVHCARCHNHKFDPISQVDYYRLAALFSPAYNVHEWETLPSRHLPDVSAREVAEIGAHNSRLDRQLEPFKKELDDLRRPTEERLLDEKLVALPEPLRADLKAAVGTAEDKRTEIQKYLTEKLGPLVKVPVTEVEKAFDEDQRKAASRVKEKISAFEIQKRSFGKIQALWDRGPPPATYLYRRGDFATPGVQVQPGVLAVLNDEKSPFVIAKQEVNSATSGRRTSLARWLVRPDHPLTARVIVNRSWQHLFGVGIVRSVDNFGLSGVEPTHPRLLDWLAAQFVHTGWSFKRLHRTIVTSTAYRQASRRLPEAEAVDPENHLLWRQSLRRLESEIVRDRVLAASGALDRMFGGPPLPLKVNPDSSVELDMGRLPPHSSQHRRSIYVFARRNYQLSELNTFDQPIVAHNCTRRTSAAVVLQSLAMLNGRFVTEQAKLFARRVLRESGSDRQRMIDVAFRLALSRRPLPREITLSENLLNEQTALSLAEEQSDPRQAAEAAARELCHMLLNTNEFLYVD